MRVSCILKETLEDLIMKRNKNIIEVNEISDSVKTSMRTRIISAVVAAIIVFPSIFLGDWFAFAVVLFLCVVAAYEIIHCVKPKHSIWLTIVSAILMLLITCWPLVRELFFSAREGADFKLWTSFGNIYLSIIVLVFAFMIIFFYVVIDKNISVSDAAFIFTVGVGVSLGLQCALYLRFIPIVAKYSYVPGMDLSGIAYFNFFENFESATLIIYVVIGTFMTDIGAYFTGVLFGRHKMNERISPKKTWEGFVGGIVFSILVSFPFALVLSLCGHPIISVLDHNHWYFILILSVLLPFFATLGDFVFSSLKRYYNIKDFGNIMPGHGGVLDRIDSIIFSFLVSAIFIGVILGRGSPLL